MGFNISGIAINKNYEFEFDELQKELGWNLIKKSQVNFETASSNWKEEGICDVYFSENGTLIFISMDLGAESWPLRNDNSLTFALSETSMAFHINYCEKGIEKRSIMEVNAKRMHDEGEKLEVEKKSEDPSEIIWNQIEIVIGKRFGDIQADEKVVRYSFNKEAFKRETQVYKKDKPKQTLPNSFSNDANLKLLDQSYAAIEYDEIEIYTYNRGELLLNHLDDLKVEKSKLLEKMEVEKDFDKELELNKRVKFIDKYEPLLEELLGKDQELHPTAKLIVNLTKEVSLTEKLNKIFQSEIVNPVISRCEEELRDGIIFKKDGKVIEALSICFSCAVIKSMNAGFIYGDRTFYKNYKNFLLNLGHDVDS